MAYRLMIYGVCSKSKICWKSCFIWIYDLYFLLEFSCKPKIIIQCKPKIEKNIGKEKQERILQQKLFWRVKGEIANWWIPDKGVWRVMNWFEFDTNAPKSITCRFQNKNCILLMKG